MRGVCIVMRGGLHCNEGGGGGVCIVIFQDDVTCHQSRLTI